MKLTYWTLKSNDSPSFDFRAETKGECTRMLEAAPCSFEGSPEKVVLEYGSALQLLDCALSDGGLQELKVN
jgi:hypothetical protein